MNDERAVGAARPAMSPPDEKEIDDRTDMEHCLLELVGDEVVCWLNGDVTAAAWLSDQDDDFLLALATRCEFNVQSRNEEVEDERNDKS